MTRRSFFAAAASAMAFLAAGPKAWGKAFTKKPEKLGYDSTFAPYEPLTEERFIRIWKKQFDDLEQYFWSVPTETTEPMAYWLQDTIS